MSAFREPGFWVVALAVATLVTLVMVAVVVVIRRRRKMNMVGQVKLPVAPKPTPDSKPTSSSTSTSSSPITSGFIHVSLSLAGDTEPAKTLLGLYRRASHKERLRWGVWTEAPDLMDRLAKMDPVSTKDMRNHVKIHTARSEAYPGEGPLRHTIETTLFPPSGASAVAEGKRQEFFVQLGPCTRALAGWDVMLLESLFAAKGDKVLLTAPVLKPISNKSPPPPQPTFTLCQGFDGGLGGNMPVILGRHFSGHPKTPVPQGFFSGSFVCGSRVWVEEVGHPDLWGVLHQLDFPMTARCWTAGWNLKAPNKLPFYLAEGKNPPPAYENTPELSTALHRVISAMGMDGGPGRFGEQDGLFTEKPLRGLFMKLGVFPAAGKVNKRGLLGLHAPERFYDEEVELKYGSEANLFQEHDRVVREHANILASPEPTTTAIPTVTTPTSAPVSTHSQPIPIASGLGLPVGREATLMEEGGEEGAQPIV